LAPQPAQLDSVVSRTSSRVFTARRILAGTSNRRSRGESDLDIGIGTGLGATLFGLGLCGGLVSGLVGLGGGVVMVPLLLYVPTALGVGTLSIKVVSGMTSVQSLAGAVSGAAGHRRHRRISRSLALTMGGSMAAGSLVGSLGSASLSSNVILGVFATMAIVASVIMLIPRAEEAAEQDVATLPYDRLLAIATGGGIGLLAGVIGQGGAFLFIPAMLYVLRIPMRIAIGTGLAIGVMSSTAVFIGRAETAQVPIVPSAILVLGVLLGAQVGSAWSQRLPRQALRGILAVLIGATAVNIWYELLFGSSAAL
jgi:uncharacterized membrane protein YfcA